MTEATAPPRTMTIVYAREEPPASYAKSIFLLGPTPRHEGVTSWRPEALRYLAMLGYDGVVFVPEDRPDSNGVTTYRGEYLDQVKWETTCLHLADVILAWVPRDLETMPGFTTNVEWGEWEDSGKIVLGFPYESVKNRYLGYKAEKFQVPFSDTPAGTVARAIELLGEGSWRSDGEREVPLYIWRTTHFQSWYRALKAAGNTLEHARVLTTVRKGPQLQRVYLWALHVEVYIAAEGRSKTNEIVLSRPDISAVMLYRRAVPINDSTVVLIREFRPSVSNDSGYVWELPGGSDPQMVTDPRLVAKHECQEETGLDLAFERFVPCGQRQLMATFSAHKATLFAVDLTDTEITYLKGQYGQPHGAPGSTERTYVEVATLGQILEAETVDWSMVGMILRVLTQI